MSNDISIKAEGLSKAYRMFSDMNQRLKHALLHSFGKEYGSVFWALKDISFEVKRGESVGIVGENGAGKSTLLQILAGTLQPNEGWADVNGRIGALLELGSGFNPEFTGRENIYMNAAVMGLKNKEIDKKFDEILDFADIGDFVEQPLKTYSSGMKMRLAFAVNTCIEPEILIVDEALAVGDAVFQSKCYTRLRKMVENGTSLLFVSHSVDTVRSLCSRALWLNHGKSVMWGDAKEVCKEYEKFCWKKQGIEIGTEGSKAEKIELSPEVLKALNDGVEDGLDERGIPNSLFLPNPDFDNILASHERYGTGELHILNYLLTDSGGIVKKTFDYNEIIHIWCIAEIKKNVDSDFAFGVTVKDLKGNVVFQLQDTYKINHLNALAGDIHVFSFKFKASLTHSTFSIRSGIVAYKGGHAFSGFQYNFNELVVWDMLETAALFSINQCPLYPIGGPVSFSDKLFTLKIEKEE